MRITGGELCGRKIKVPKESVRPTQDMVREALFSILASRIGECSFLDLYAGAGAVGLEAWSRGAETVVWVEKDRNVLSVLKQNVEDLTGSGSGLYGRDTMSFLKKNPTGHVFDVIFADPPYTGGVKDGVTPEKVLLEKLLGAVASGGVLAEDGVFIYEQRTKDPLLEIDGWRLMDKRKYGQTALCFYCVSNEK